VDPQAGKRPKKAYHYKERSSTF